MTGELVLLTGATGFLGIKVLVHALSAGYRVRCAIRSSDGIKKILSTPTISKMRPSEKELSWIVVPSITEPGAYGEAVKGVQYIIHCASPVPDMRGEDPSPETDEEVYIKPSVRGAIGMLESAAAKGAPTVKRIVITSSIVAIVPVSEFISPGSNEFSADHRVPNMTPPYPPGLAYVASKVASINAIDAWMAEHKPSFDIINTMPLWIWGHDEFAKTPDEFLKGASGKFINFLTGKKADSPINSGVVGVEDSARAHVLALRPDVKGNQSFIHGRVEDFERGRDIAKAKFPEAFASGLFREDGVQPTVQIPTDDRKVEEHLNMKWTSFEELVEETVGQFVELSGQK